MLYAAAVLPQKPDFEEGMGGKEGLCPCTVDGLDLHSLTMIQWAEEKEKEFQEHMLKLEKEAEKIGKRFETLGDSKKAMIFTLL